MCVVVNVTCIRIDKPLIKVVFHAFNPSIFHLFLTVGNRS